AAVAAGDKRGHGSERCRVSTFSSTTFEQALEGKETDWFRKKLRCDMASFLLIYRAIYAACPQKPAANAKHKLIKRVALVMYYLAQGGQMDQAGMPLGSFRSLSICAGSNNDQSLWNGSAVKKRLSTYVPAGRHLLGDAGYKLWNHLLTPY
ncbi:hypothetical protein PF006_g32864, partial [Phytophthora fragariae]